ncbi:MAG: HD domain-containing protein [Candidatus Aenigmarchaeota archaeon]|nr:HD domain-containing protein [Candidatus Aenigmarchaeota archaeon]
MRKLWFKKLKNKIKVSLKKDYSGHNYWHAIRVCNICKYIRKKEKADLDVLLAASLLHDIYAGKNYATHVEKAIKFAKKVLKEIGFPKNKIPDVLDCIKNHEKYNWGKTSKISKEAKILQDADRLDALGAIGIARIFTFGGFYGRPIYNPKDKPRVYYRFSRTRKSSITHFYEKILRLKDNMNTKTGRKIAEKRHKFMERYLKRFFKEWRGKM